MDTTEDDFPARKGQKSKKHSNSQISVEERRKNAKSEMACCGKGENGKCLIFWDFADSSHLTYLMPK